MFVLTWAVVNWANYGIQYKLNPNSYHQSVCACVRAYVRVFVS